MAAILLVWMPAHAADIWVEVRSPHFTIATNLSADTGRHLVWQFEQIRSGLQTAWPWVKADLDRPVLILAARDVTTMKLLVPQEWEGHGSIHYWSYEWTGTDRNYFVLDASRDMTDVPEGVNPFQQTYWSYADLAMGSGLNWRLPFWFQKGLAAVLSNTIIGKNDMQSGRPVPRYVDEIKLGRFPLDRLFAITEESPEYRNDVERNRFIAQSWGLMEYLLYGTPGPQGAARIDTLAGEILAGTPPGEAVTKVFGSLAALDAAYTLYIDQGRMFYTVWKLDATQTEKGYPSRPLRPAEVLADRAAWYVTEKRPVEARAAIADARKLEPELAATYDAEGRLFESQNAAADASTAFDRAAELKSDDFYSYFQAARPMLGPGRASADAITRATALLTRALELNPQYASSHSFLASALEQANQLPDAIGHARAAAALMPAFVPFRVQLARLMARDGQKDNALRVARDAELIARTDADRRLVQTLLSDLQRGGMSHEAVH